MDIVISESSPEKFVSVWMSFVTFRICSREAKLKFREVEKIALKICLLNSHLSFYETRLNNKLLPILTNIFIYILSCFFLSKQNQLFFLRLKNIFFICCNTIFLHVLNEYGGLLLSHANLFWGISLTTAIFGEVFSGILDTNTHPHSFCSFLQKSLVYTRGKIVFRILVHYSNSFNEKQFLKKNFL